eukprot:490082_1
MLSLQRQFGVTSCKSKRLQIAIILTVVFGLIIFFHVIVTDNTKMLRFSIDTSNSYNITFTNCENIYIDLGSNIGVQTRKLFEPEKYPNSTVLSHYDITFGSVTKRRKNCCSFGFEANPKHFDRLHEIEQCYNKKGWRTKFYILAVWINDDDTIEIHTDDENKYEDWGAGIIGGEQYGRPNQQGKIFNVKTIDIAKWIKTVIEINNPKNVFVKMDIEGSEFMVLPRLAASGILCEKYINTMVMELHRWALLGVDKMNLNDELIKEFHEHQLDTKTTRSKFYNTLKSWIMNKIQCKKGINKTVFVRIDDETYVDDGMLLPMCSV